MTERTVSLKIIFFCVLVDDVFLIENPIQVVLGSNLCAIDFSNMN